MRHFPLEVRAETRYLAPEFSEQILFNLLYINLKEKERHYDLLMLAYAINASVLDIMIMIRPYFVYFVFAVAYLIRGKKKSGVSDKNFPLPKFPPNFQHPSKNLTRFFIPAQTFPRYR